MKADSATTVEIVGFICDELRRHPNERVAMKAGMIMRHCVQATLLAETSDRAAMLILWISDWWSYAGITAEWPLQDIEQTASDYTTHILGFKRPVHVVIGHSYYDFKKEVK
jgi:hypothetical protein